MNQRDTVLTLIDEGLATTGQIAQSMAISQPQVRSCLCKLKREGLVRVVGIDGDFTRWGLVEPEDSDGPEGPAPKIHPKQMWAYADRLPRVSSVFELGAIA